MKKVALSLLFALAVGWLNGAYFEYCVSRASPQILTTAGGFVLVIIDIFTLIYFVRLLMSALNLTETKNKKQSKSKKSK